MSILTPTPTAIVPFTIPDDGDDVDAASVNVAFTALGNAAAYNTPRTDSLTDGQVWTAPCDCRIFVYMRAPGGGGGGGSRGNATNTDNQYTTGGGGGGAGELKQAYFDVNTGDELTFASGALGAGGAGSGSGNGANGGDATDATLTSDVDGLLLTARGGLGGGHGIRNIDFTTEFGASIGGRPGYPDGSPRRFVDQIAATANEASGLWAHALLFTGPGAGASMSAGVIQETYSWPAPNGSVATNGTQGAADVLKIGGLGGGGGGSTELALGGAGGNGGDAVAGGAAGVGSAGSNATALSGGGGGGGGAGGTGSSAGGGGNGGDGAVGYCKISYHGPQAVIA